MLNILICSISDNNAKDLLEAKEFFKPSDKLRKSLQELSGVFMFVFIMFIAIFALVFGSILNGLNFYCLSLNAFKKHFIDDLERRIKSLSLSITEIEEKIKHTNDNAENEKLRRIIAQKTNSIEVDSNFIKTINTDEELLRRKRKADLYFFTLKFFSLILLLILVLIKSPFDQGVYFESIVVLSKINEKNKDQDLFPKLEEEFKKRFKNRFFKSCFNQVFTPIFCLFLFYTICNFLLFKFVFYVPFNNWFFQFRKKIVAPVFLYVCAFLIPFFVIKEDYFDILEQYIEEEEQFPEKVM